MGPTTVAAGDNLAIVGDTFNMGPGTAAASTTHFYLSPIRPSPPPTG
jgi:hypothetical protein